jgi:hypothetical protein
MAWQLGNAMQPQTVAPVQGPVPASPEEKVGLEQKWNNFLAQPGVQAGLLQFGASMLANASSGNGFARNLGMALGDAGGAAGRSVAMTAQQQQQAAENQDRTEGRNIQREGLQVQRENQQADNLNTQRQLDLTEQGQVLTAKNAAAQLGMDEKTLALKEKELGLDASYKKLIASIEQQKVSKTPGSQTPRDRALLQLQKDVYSNYAMDDTYDVAGEVAKGLEIIDQMFPEGTAAMGAPSATPPASTDAAPAPTAPQTRVPGDVDLPGDQSLLKTGIIYYHPEYGRIKLTADGKGFEQVQ